MKISNLIGFPKETDDFVMVEIPEIKIKFFGLRKEAEGYVK